MAIDWTRFAECVRAGQRFVLTSHVKPDCDAIGSELAMAEILRAIGKEVRIVNADSLPGVVQFLDGGRGIEQLGKNADPAEVAQADTIMVLDTSSWNQLGAMADVVRASPARKIVLDHHASSDDLGAAEFKDVAAEATGALVYQAAEALGVQITQAMAEPLLAAIATDTGWFRFNSVTAQTYRTVAALIDAGASPTRLYASLYENDTLARVQITGRILTRTRQEFDGRLAYTTATLDDFAATGADRGDTENIVNRCLAIGGVEVAMLFVEQPGGAVKVSFRSKGRMDVARLAERFGGGGHKPASGATIIASLDAAICQVLDALRESMG